MNSKCNRDTMAGSVYDKQYFTDDEMQRMQDVVDAASSGRTDWGSAHSLVEGLREKYGYSGGEDGSAYHKVEKPFTYDWAPTYERKYQNQIDTITRQLLNRPKFQYDSDSDPLYQSYKRQYTSAGQKAMQDTLGQVSARTGGLASSYAHVAAQQTYDGYMSALADKVPELYQLAYQMYQDEGNNQRTNLNMLQGLEQDDYARYVDLLGQYNTDRNFDYGVHRDDISDGRYDNEWNYSVGRDQIADKRYEDETAYNRQTYEDETQYSRALAKAQTLAATGDFSGYRELGYTDAEIANLKTAYNKTQAAPSSGGGGRDYTGALDKMLSFGDDDKAYLYLLGLGFSNEKTDEIMRRYEKLTEQTAQDVTDEMPNPENQETAPAGTYEQAEEYVKALKSLYGGRAPTVIEAWLKTALKDGTITNDWYTRLYRYAM